MFDCNQSGVDRFTKEVKFDVQLFGREHTYWRGYQLQSFFCLEGDKDADDPIEAPKPEHKNLETSAPIAAKKPVNQKPVETSTEEKQPDAAPVRDEAAVVERAETSVPNHRNEADKRTANERLLDAKKQLNWEIPKDFDTFAKEHIDKFPGYVTATKMSNDQKEVMWNLLVEYKNVIPF